MLMSFSWNVACSYNLIERSIRFDILRSHGDAEVNLINIIKNKQALHQCFAEAHKQYIAENNILDELTLSQKRVIKNKKSKSIGAFVKDLHLEERHYCLLIKHPCAPTWKVTAFITK